MQMTGQGLSNEVSRWVMIPTCCVFGTTGSPLSGLIALLRSMHRRSQACGRVINMSWGKGAGIRESGSQGVRESGSRQTH